MPQKDITIGRSGDATKRKQQKSKDHQIFSMLQNVTHGIGVPFAFVIGELVYCVPNPKKPARIHRTKRTGEIFELIDRLASKVKSNEGKQEGNEKRG